MTELNLCSDAFKKFLENTTESETPICLPGDLDCSNDSCLVQIYPADCMDGILLLDDDVLRIGRDFECGLSLDDGNVSRRHAEIVQCTDGYILSDACSTNGTYVNGIRISTKRLESGDQIGIGPFIFKYLSAGCIETHYHEAVYSSLTRDALTGAYNKRFLLDSMRREIARSRRDGCVLAVVMMDIDHFKSINDNYGHLIGDQVLQEFGARMNSICREDDLFARYGGEEFCLLLSSTIREQAIEISERCRLIVAENQFHTESGDLSVTASFGICCFAGIGSPTCEDLISQADEALYQAKRLGRNQVVCDS